MCFLQVYHNDNERSTYSGNVASGESILSQSGQIRVTFESDSSVNARGFYALFQTGNLRFPVHTVG